MCATLNSLEIGLGSCISPPPTLFQRVLCFAGFQLKIKEQQGAMADRWVTFSDFSQLSFDRLYLYQNYTHFGTTDMIIVSF